MVVTNNLVKCLCLHCEGKFQVIKFLSFLRVFPSCRFWFDSPAPGHTDIWVVPFNCFFRTPDAVCVVKPTPSHVSTLERENPLLLSACDLGKSCHVKQRKAHEVGLFMWVMLTVSGNTKQTDAEPMWLRKSIRFFFKFSEQWTKRNWVWLIFFVWGLHEPSCNNRCRPLRVSAPIKQSMFWIVVCLLSGSNRLYLPCCECTLSWHIWSIEHEMVRYRVII